MWTVSYREIDTFTTGPTERVSFSFRTSVAADRYAARMRQDPYVIGVRVERTRG
jgi:hypothetical protein